MKELRENYPLYNVTPIQSLQELLRTAVARTPEKLALEDLASTPVGQVTFAQLVEHVVRFGRALRRLGLGERDHVAILAENRVQWAVAYLAIVTFDMVVVPVDKSLPDNEVVTILHVSDAKAVVFSESYRDTVLTLAPAVKGLKVFVDMDLAARDGKLQAMTELLASEQGPAGIGDLPRHVPGGLDRADDGEEAPPVEPARQEGDNLLRPADVAPGYHQHHPCRRKWGQA